MAMHPVVNFASSPFLERLPESSRDHLLANSTQTQYDSGSIAYQPGDPERPGILASGFARVYVTSPEGRQTTVRYVHSGELMGSPIVMHAPLHGSLQMVTDCLVVELDLSTVRRRARLDTAVAYALATDLALRYSHTVQILALHAFGTVEERVAFDLLDRACRAQLSTGLLKVSVSHQEIADGVGSVRTVVSRALAGLRERGLVELSRRSVKITNPIALEAFAFASVA